MSSNVVDPDTGIYSLPQCGFGADIDFDTLIQTNQFLFRVYTPKERSPFSDDTDPFFIAPRFDDQVARSPVDLPNVKFPETVVGSYAEVARHMEWTTKSSSCYLSASFSFAWAIWEAARRYHVGVKKDVEIAIIDASALGGRAATAVQLLMKSSPRQRDEKFWKWHRFSQDSQTVLVYGMVPRPAVLASIPLLSILRKMPSYFLRMDMQVIPGNPLDQVAWNYTNRKQTYRQFCQDVSNIFLGRPAEVQLRDSTGGAVRLALSFLRPFFHRVVQEDLDIAISYLRTLTIAISEWPGDRWVTGHPEVQEIVESMVLALGEELREKYFIRQGEEISNLHVVIGHLEQSINAQKEQANRHIVDELDVDSDGGFEVELEESDEPTLVTSGPLPKPSTLHRRPSSLKVSFAVLPRPPLSFQTPITPPDSPRNSLSLPSVTVPLSDAVSTQFTFKPLPLASQQLQLTTVPSPKVADEDLASPPPTPPFRSPVFSPPKSPLVENTLSHPEKSESLGQEVHGQDNPTGAEQEQDEAERLEKEIEEMFAKDVLAHIQVGPTLSDIIEDDGEETELEDGVSFPTSPSMSWVPMSPSMLSSRRSSIMSLETLCESPDMPFKRLSFARSRTTSFDFARIFPPQGSLGLHSRTVSFSEPMLGLIPYPTPPNIAVVEPLTIPLPPSPTSTTRSSTSSPSVSPSICLSSECSSSSSSSASSTPPPHALDLPIEKHMSKIIPPRRRISLLSPLPEQEETDSDSDTLSIRSTGIVETTSYIVTGFLVGAFITLFLFSTQRRTLLYVS